MLIESGLAVVDFFKGLIKGRDLWKELKFVPSRVIMCVLLRELIVIGAKIDIARDIPIIHLNLTGYHEQSHRRGATSRFAHWTLRGIDDAILSSYPMQLIKKGALLRNPKFSFLEPRGALWVEVNLNSQPIQIINTHLGLNSKERLLHAKELIDTKWLAHPKCKVSVILCGDFNSLAYSGAFKILQGNLSSVSTRKGRIRHKSAWFGRYPVVCLDQIL